MTASDADPRIDAALSRVEDLADLPPEEHVPIYENMHETLQQVLTDAGDPNAVARATAADHTEEVGGNVAAADSVPHAGEPREEHGADSADGPAQT